MRPRQWDAEICPVCGAPIEREPRLVTVSAARRICRVSRSTLYRWMQEGRIEWVSLPSGARRLFADSLFRRPSGEEFEISRRVR